MNDIIKQKKIIYEFSQMTDNDKYWLIDLYAARLSCATLNNKLDSHKYNEEYIKKYYPFIEKEIKIKAAEMIFKQFEIDRENSKFKKN